MSRLRLIALLLALITLMAYLPVTRDSFLSFDDSGYVAQNQFVQNGLTWPGIKWAFTTYHTGIWHPLTWLSLMLDCELFGPNSGALHYVNVLFHTINAVLLLLLLFRLTGALWPSAFVAALFAWHPLHVESVAWLSERKDVLSTFFGLLVLLAYVRYAQKRSKTDIAIRALGSGLSTLNYFLALLFFALGLMAKPMLVTLPFVFMLLDYWPLQRVPNYELRFSAWLQLIREKWPFFVLAAASCAVTFFAENEGITSFQQVPPSLRLSNAFVSYLGYLWKTIWPAKLSIMYPLPHHLPWAEVAAAAIFLMIITWFSWRVRRRQPYLLVGWFWFLGTLAPVIGFVQLGFQSPGDRYTYIPLVGIFIAVAFGFKDLIARFQIQVIPSVVGAGLVLGNCLVVTEYQLGFWRNDETLFSHAVAVTKNNAGARLNLGATFAAQGRITEALAQFQEAERISPSNAMAHIFLGEVFAETGKTSEALAQCQEAQNVLSMNSEQPLLHYYLGSLLVQLGHLDEAMDQYNQAAQLGSDNPRLYYDMGRLLLMQDRDAEAVDKLREALQMDPYDVSVLNLLAEILASDAHAQIRNGAEAVTLAEKANTLTDGKQPSLLDVLAMAYAETGRFKEAQLIEQRAIQLAQASGLETNEMNQRLQLYQSDRPYRK